MSDRPFRASTAFERPPGNVYEVPDDGGPPLEDLSGRPAPTSGYPECEDE